MPQWIPTVDFDAIDDEDVVRFDHGGRTFAIYRVEDKPYASDGLCTHEGVHLGAKVDEGLGQVGAHEAVGTGDEHRPAAVDVPELALELGESAVVPGRVAHGGQE